MSNKLIIKIDKTTISNDKIYQEGFELAESLCSQSELRFGCCESSVLKLKIRNEFGELNGKTLDVLIALNGDTENLFKIGTYKVETCERSGDRQYLNITAYDKMYDIINANVTEWYNSLTFPLSMKAFRDSFFAYINVSQETTVLTQDSVIIEKTIDADEISGLKVISAICELNGAFGNVDKNGVFKYIFLEKELEPIKTYAKYVSCEYEDFTTKPISKVQVRQEEGDIGAISGTGDNTYIVNDNFLVYGKSPSDLSTIADRLFAKIKGVSYMPFKATVQGDPCVEVGDVIKISTKTKEVTSYLLERTIKGIQSLKDSFESKGVYEYSEKVNSANKETRQLKGKVNKLTRTVEETVSEIKDLEKNIDTKITQTAEEIFSEASKKFVTEESIEELQRQIDGAIETFTGSAVPTVSNYPTIEWVTSEEKDKHIGDLFIVNDKGGEYAGFYYRFEKNNSAYSWVLLKDNEITKALQDSKEANEKSEEAKKKALEVEKNLADNYITETEVKSAINQSAEEISTTVSKNYSTKTEVSSAKTEAINSANTNTDNKLKNYSTTTEMNSAITQKANGITSEVNKKITETKTYAENVASVAENNAKKYSDSIEIGGRNLVLSSKMNKNGGHWSFPKDIKYSFDNGYLEMRRGSTTSTSRAAITQINNALLFPNADFVKNETFTLSAEVKAIEDVEIDTNNTIFYRIFVGSKIYELTCVVPTDLSSDKWTKISSTKTFGDNEYTEGSFIMGVNKGGYCVRNIKLEKGDKATDWTPAPEDLEEDSSEKANNALEEAKLDIDDKLLKYSTTEELESLIEQNEASIMLYVADKYTTKAEVANIEIGGRNLIIQKNLTDGWANSTGSITSSSKYKATDYISVDSGDKLIFQLWTDEWAKYWVNVTYYGEDKKYISGYSENEYYTATHVVKKITISSNTIKYIRVSYAWKDGFKAKLEKGDKATDWTPAPEDYYDYKEITAMLKLYVDKDNLVSYLNASADVIKIKGNRFSVESEYFKVSEDGTIKAQNGEIGGFTLKNGTLSTSVQGYILPSSDVIETLKTAILEGTSLPTAYDFNADGSCDLFDIVYVKNYINGSRTKEQFKKWKYAKLSDVFFTIDPTNADETITLTAVDMWGGTRKTQLGINGLETQKIEVNDSLTKTIAVNREATFGASGTPCLVEIYGSANKEKVIRIYDGVTKYYDDTVFSLWGNMRVRYSIYTDAQFVGTVATSSDKNVKKDIAPLDKEKSANFIYSLTPTEFKMINGESDRYHHGFIAQEVKEVMGEDDWGVFIDHAIKEENYETQISDENGNTIVQPTARYSLRYDEFVADIVATLQSQHEKILELEKEILLIKEKKYGDT